MRSGSVAIVGRTNVGKSTLFNALLGMPLAIVSPLPQTTRDALLGVVRKEEAEIALVDTPGLHRPKHELGRRLNYTALETLRQSDAILFVTDVNPRARTADSLLLFDDQRLCKALPQEHPVILVINKIDLLRDKTRLLPLIKAFSELYPFVSYAPVSVKRQDGLAQLVSELERLLPEREARYDDDTLTDRPSSFFAREYVREQVLLFCFREVPHAVAVTLDEFSMAAKRAEIKATIHVEKTGQRGILIGEKGSRIKQMASGAGQRLKELLGCPVTLTIFVRVTPSWRTMPRQLAELGYETEGARDLSALLPKIERRAMAQKRPRRLDKQRVKPKRGHAS